MLRYQRSSLAMLRRRPELALAARRRLSPEHRSAPQAGLLSILRRASYSLDLRKFSISEADMKRLPTCGVDPESRWAWTGAGAVRISWRITASPNSLDTLCAAWIRDTAELDRAGWMGSAGSGASNAGLCLRLRGSDRDRTEGGELSSADARYGGGAGNCSG